MNLGLVVVISGTSSGIGRATAVALSRKQAILILCGRDAASLEETRREYISAGAKSVTSACLDVRDVAAVEALGHETTREHGRIDVWINCAATLAFGRFEDIPPEAFAGAIETNVLV